MLLKLIRALLVASVAVPIVAFGLFAWHSHNESLRAAEERAQRLASVVQEHTLKVFETIGLVLHTADQRLRGVSWDQIANSRPLWDELKKLEHSSEQVGAIFVVNRDGLGTLTTRAFPSPPVDFSDRDYYAEQRRVDQGLYVGQAYVGKISHDPIFNFSIRRTMADGSFDGVIGVSAYVRYFENYYRELGLEDDRFAIALVRTDGSILVRYPAIGSSYTRIPSDSSFMHKLYGDHGTCFARSPFNAQERLYAFTKVRGYPVYAVYGIDQRAIRGEWLDTALQGAALAIVVGFCLFITAWFALQRAKQEALAHAGLTRTTQALQEEIEKRKRAEASLLQAQRLEAVGQLTGGIAHDFNNLLTIISGNLDLADRRDDLKSIRRLLRSIRYASERATSLTRQLLAFSRRHMVNPKTLSLTVALDRTRVLIEHTVPENIALTFDLPEDLCPVNVDVSEFEAAVLNLAVNARDAMPDGGALKISLRELILRDDDERLKA